MKGLVKSEELVRPVLQHVTNYSTDMVLVS